MKKLLIIDPQYDFTNPNGRLYVANAENDMKNLCDFIEDNIKELSEIVVSLDTHNYYDISHNTFWIDSKGNTIQPFTTITYDDFICDRIIPFTQYLEHDGIVYDVFDEVEKYLLKMQELDTPHIVFPTHCLNGSIGNSVDENLFKTLIRWSEINGVDVKYVRKGLNPFTEHFGIFKSLVEYYDTMFNYELLESLDGCDLYIGGEAKNFCVINTISQIMSVKPLMMKNVKLLSNYTSNVVGFENLGSAEYKKAYELGMINV